MTRPYRPSRYRPPAWLPATWPRGATDEALEDIDPHRLIVAGLTTEQAADRIVWHQGHINADHERRRLVDKERAELGMPPADWPTAPIRHHETVIAAVLAIHHQTPPRRRK